MLLSASREGETNAHFAPVANAALSTDAVPLWFDRYVRTGTARIRSERLSNRGPAHCAAQGGVHAPFHVSAARQSG